MSGWKRCDALHRQNPENWHRCYRLGPAKVLSSWRLANKGAVHCPLTARGTGLEAIGSSSPVQDPGDVPRLLSPAQVHEAPDQKKQTVSKHGSRQETLLVWPYHAEGSKKERPKLT